jgi:hypothetical protein
MSLRENEASDNIGTVWVLGAKAGCYANRNPQRQQGRLNQLKTDCVEQR